MIEKKGIRLTPIIMVFMAVATCLNIWILIRQPKHPSKSYTDYIDSVNKKNQQNEQELIQRIIDEQRKNLILLSENDSNLLILAITNKTTIQKNRKAIQQIKKRQNEVIDINSFSAGDLQRYFSNLERHQ